MSLRAEHGKGVVALLPLNPMGGAVARLSYDSHGKFKEEWVKPLSVQNQITDISIVGDLADPTSYVIMATVNPGAKVEAFSTEGKSLWVKDYDIKDVYPSATKDQGFWCQECWSIWALDEEVMLSCGVAELTGGD